MHRPIWTLYLGLASAVALLLFAWLAIQMVGGQTMAFDSEVRGAVHSWASPRLTYAMRGITYLGSPAFVIVAGGLVIWRLAVMGRRCAAVLLVAATLGAEALDQMLKLLFRRPRPETFFGLADPSTYSFPSGHAITSACFYGTLAVIMAVRVSSPWGKIFLWAGAALVALLIGLSRVYLGVHYPTDVLAGYAAAVVWLFAVRAGYLGWLRRVANRRAERASRPANS